LPALIVNGGDRLWKVHFLQLRKPRDLDLDVGSGHTAYCRASLIDLYASTKFHWNRTNFLWSDVRTDPRTYWRTDIFPSNVIRSTRRSRPNNVTIVITYFQNCEIGPWLMNTDRPVCYVEWKICPLFQFGAWNIGAERERSRSRIWWMGAEQWACVKKLAGAGAGGRGAGNEAGSESHRNSFERRSEILPHPLRWHALFVIISRMQHQQDHIKYHVFASSTSLLPLTLSIITSWSHVSSVFAIYGPVLNWFKCQNCEKNNLSSLHTSSCSPGSVLGPLHLIKYTTPHSTRIFSLPLNHKHYTDHTQLFFSFRPSIF